MQQTHEIVFDLTYARRRRRRTAPTFWRPDWIECLFLKDVHIFVTMNNSYSEPFTEPTHMQPMTNLHTIFKLSDVEVWCTRGVPPPIQVGMPSWFILALEIFSICVCVFLRLVVSQDTIYMWVVCKALVVHLSLGTKALLIPYHSKHYFWLVGWHFLEKEILLHTCKQQQKCLWKLSLMIHGPFDVWGSFIFYFLMFLSVCVWDRDRAQPEVGVNKRHSTLDQSHKIQMWTWGGLQKTVEGQRHCLMFKVVPLDSLYTSWMDIMSDALNVSTNPTQFAILILIG